MLTSDHPRRASNTSASADVDVTRLSFLLARSGQLSADLSDAGYALRSLMGGRRGGGGTSSRSGHAGSHGGTLIAS